MQTKSALSLWFAILRPLIRTNKILKSSRTTIPLDTTSHISLRSEYLLMFAWFGPSKQHNQVKDSNYRKFKCANMSTEHEWPLTVKTPYILFFKADPFPFLITTLNTVSAAVAQRKIQFKLPCSHHHFSINLICFPSYNRQHWKERYFTFLNLWTAKRRIMLSVQIKIRIHTYCSYQFFQIDNDFAKKNNN